MSRCVVKQSAYTTAVKFLGFVICSGQVVIIYVKHQSTNLMHVG